MVDPNKKCHSGTSSMTKTRWWIPIRNVIPVPLP
ncbi:hypothetical protein T11_9723 [Trichinella zimbabwensis]|uniref:Uncharacterized protein n=1 Tax=Trichinella zimbabwensis TaxID=268475 RepID=A0A0V1G733_9BILA|nr:hypothetical protein T11_17804 [Trichinella zimbabwensis]KRY94736.1 hypothetical protein T11_9723 [Trichinella zimbabwensis]